MLVENYNCVFFKDYYCAFTLNHQTLHFLHLFYFCHIWLHNLKYCVQEVDPEDEEALTKFMSHNPPARRTLADIIQEKLTEKKTEIQSHMTGRPVEDWDTESHDR